MFRKLHKKLENHLQNAWDNQSLHMDKIFEDMPFGKEISNNPIKFLRGMAKASPPAIRQEFIGAASLFTGTKINRDNFLKKKNQTPSNG